MQLLPAFQGSASAPFLRNGSAALPIGRRLFGKKAFSKITSDSLTWKSDVAQDNKAQCNHDYKEHKAKYHAEQMLSLPDLWKGFRASLYITDEFYYCNYKKNDWGSKNHAPPKKQILESATYSKTGRIQPFRQSGWPSPAQRIPERLLQSFHLWHCGNC